MLRSGLLPNLYQKYEYEYSAKTSSGLLWGLPTSICKVAAGNYLLFNCKVGCWWWPKLLHKLVKFLHVLFKEYVPCFVLLKQENGDSKTNASFLLIERDSKLTQTFYLTLVPFGSPVRATISPTISLPPLPSPCYSKSLSFCLIHPQPPLHPPPVDTLVRTHTSSTDCLSSIFCSTLHRNTNRWITFLAPELCTSISLLRESGRE